MPNKTVIVGIIISLCLIVAMLLYFYEKSPPASPEEAEARRIVLLCSGGELTYGKVELAANLAQSIRKLSGQAQVSSQRIGAVIQNLRSDAFGRDMYTKYVECLKTQMILSLQQRGVTVALSSDRADSTVGRSKQVEIEKYSASTEGDCGAIIQGSNVNAINLSC